MLRCTLLALAMSPVGRQSVVHATPFAVRSDCLCRGVHIKVCFVDGERLVAFEMLVLPGCGRPGRSKVGKHQAISLHRKLLVDDFLDFGNV